MYNINVMIIFEKVLSIKAILIAISALFLFNSQAYPYSFQKETLRVPSSFKNQRVVSGKTTQIDFLKRALVTAAILGTMNNAAVAYSPPGMYSHIVIETNQDNIKAMVKELLSKMKYPEAYRLAIAQEISKLVTSKQMVNFLKTRNIDMTKLIGDSKNGGYYPLLDFFKELRELLNKEGYLNQENPKQVIKLLAGPDIFDMVKKSPNVTQETKELMAGLAGCSAKSMLGMLLADYLGIRDMLIGVSDEHVFNLIPIADNNYLIIDITTGWFRMIDFSRYYRVIKEGGYKSYYLVLENRIENSRLSELRNALKQGGADYLINEYGASEEELLALFYPIIHIQDRENLEAIPLINKGIIYFNFGYLKEAEDALLEALKLNAQLDEAYTVLGNVYTGQGRYPEAEKAFDAALDKNDKNPKTYVNLGVLYGKQKEWKRAEEQFLKSADLGYTHPFLYSNLGMAFYYQGKFDQAIKAYSSAIELDPNDPDSYFGLGASRYALRMRDSKSYISLFNLAIEDYAKAIELSSKSDKPGVLPRMLKFIPEEIRDMVIESLPREAKKKVREVMKDLAMEKPSIGHLGAYHGLAASSI